MNDLNRLKGNNIGGVIRFNFIPVQDVQSIALPINHKVLEPLELKEGKRWYCAYATIGTMAYSEEQSDNDNGNIYKPKFIAICPQDNEEMTDTLNAMRNQRFIIDYTDANGLRKLVGTIEEPLFFTSTLSTKNDVKGRNEHAISFYGECTHKAYVYDI
jgi:hypothetical protein